MIGVADYACDQGGSNSTIMCQDIVITFARRSLIG